MATLYLFTLYLFAFFVLFQRKWAAGFVETCCLSPKNLKPTNVVSFMKGCLKVEHIFHKINMIRKMLFLKTRYNTNLNQDLW